MAMTRASLAWAGVALACAALAATQGCASSSGDDPLGQSEQFAQPIDRMLLGAAAKYPADPSLRAKNAVLDANMAERRKAAWTIAQKVLTPVKIKAHAPPAAGKAAAPAIELPRFQTWYSKDDILPMFDHLFRALPDADKAQHAPFSGKAIASVFPWNATMATSLASFTEERLEARKRELAEAAGARSLGKDARVLMSPDYVAHVLGSYRDILDCKTRLATAQPGVFAPCLNGEFPIAAAAVKTRWMPGDEPIPTYDTSAPSLTTKLTSGNFGDGDGTASPDESSIYTMKLGTSGGDDVSMRLVALHIMTKELRDWAWITLWWSPDPSSDFGADRPASLSTGPFANYKMCVVTAYSEKDAAPGASFVARGMPSLAASLAAAAGEGPATWCSNPYLETPLRAAKTSCIGCHQHGGTGETTETVLGNPDRFPDVGRTKLRATFPSDYAFTLEGGLDLAAEMRLRADALTPP